MGMSRSESGKLGGIKSKETSHRLKQERIEAYNKNKNICSFCLKELEYNKRQKKFCSKNCSAKLNNLKRSKIQEVKCLSSNCNKTFKTYKTSLGNPKKYCSHKCQQAYEREENYKKLLAGESIKLKHNGIRNILIDKYGARCMGGPTDDTKDCRWDKINPSTGKCPIELDHIDGDSSNNRLDNLKLLCPSCHSLTPTYKALNSGKGRYKRMKRYKEGKSY